MKRKFECGDCGGSPDCPIIHDELFIEINGSLKGLLCIDCAEKRLGRDLTVDDLKPVVANAFTRRLIERREKP